MKGLYRTSHIDVISIEMSMCLQSRFELEPRGSVELQCRKVPLVVSSFGLWGIGSSICGAEPSYFDQPHLSWPILSYCETETVIM